MIQDLVQLINRRVDRFRNRVAAIWAFMLPERVKLHAVVQVFQEQAMVEPYTPIADLTLGNILDFDDAE